MVTNLLFYVGAACLIAIVVLLVLDFIDDAREKKLKTKIK
jgi:hypothetical protein